MGSDFFYMRPVTQQTPYTPPIIPPKKEDKKMSEEKTKVISKGFKTYKDSTKEVCIVKCIETGDEIVLDKQIFEEVRKVMNW